MGGDEPFLRYFLLVVCFAIGVACAIGVAPANRLRVSLAVAVDAGPRHFRTAGRAGTAHAGQLSQFDALMTQYGGLTTDEERYALLQKAELLIKTQARRRCDDGQPSGPQGCRST
jgi:hypothetical protein